MFKEINDMNVNLIAVVSDSAPSYTAARYVFVILKLLYFTLYCIINNFILFNRRRLRLKHVHITFLPCFAYQMNLFVGEIFKESDTFK